MYTKCIIMLVWKISCTKLINKIKKLSKKKRIPICFGLKKKISTTHKMFTYCDLPFAILILIWMYYRYCILYRYTHDMTICNNK